MHLGTWNMKTILVLRKCKFVQRSWPKWAVWCARNTMWSRKLHLATFLQSRTEQSNIPMLTPGEGRSPPHPHLELKLPFWFLRSPSSTMSPYLTSRALGRAILHSSLHNFPSFLSIILDISSYFSFFLYLFFFFSLYTLDGKLERADGPASPPLQANFRPFSR